MKRPHLCIAMLLLLLLLLSAGAAAFRDKAALLELKAAMVDSSGSLVEWSDVDDSPCLWTGVTCNDHSTSVVALDLSNRNLSGVISPAIGRLPELINLTLDTNNFTGNLPPELLASLPSLRFLNVSHNNFTGDFPRINVTAMKQLEVLDGYNNNFSGPLPRELGFLPRIRHAHLGGSYFTGKIPHEYGNATTLEFLAINGNWLDGEIPREFGNLINLQELYLGYYNVFTGGIPRELGNLVNLAILDMASCGLDGELPPEFGNLSSLNSLFLQINNLSGDIPVSLGDLANLRSLDLSNNRFTGAIPPEFAKLQNLKLLSLFINELQGEIPDFVADLPSLEVFLLWTNNFTGSLPQRLGENGKLRELDVSSNAITGPLPPLLCSGNTLEVLVLLDCRLTGIIPAALGHCKSLNKVRLSNNQFEGSIPEGLLALKALEMLDLIDNGLGGVIPGIIDAPLLNFLDLSNNRLEGPIPEDIGKLPSLEKLQLQSNKLVGPLPRQLGKLEHIELLDMHDNALSGEIPGELAGCGKLNYIDLSENRFTGRIPPQLGTMQVLGFLNLSRNRLSGGIPPEISDLLSLTSADFSYNRLTGEIPSDGHFGSFNVSSFVGNPGLCGRGLQKCSSSGEAGNIDNSGASGSSKSKKAAVLRTFVITLFVAALFFLVGGLTVFMRSNREQLWSCSRSRTDGTRPWTLINFRRLDFTIQDVLDALNDDNIIGKGGSGTVYRADMPNGEIVAVKKFPKAGVQDLESGSTNDHGFSAEIETLGKIRHKNIVKLLGCCSNEEVNLLLFEYMPNGSLGELLHSKKRGVLDWSTRYNIAVQAAHGLSYLHHDCSPLIVHRDVKSNNILLDSEYEARVADFGLAKFFKGGSCGGKSESMSSVAGTYGYIAPEYAYTLKVNERSDVYSFGVLLLELITGRKPVESQDARDGRDEQNLVSWVRKYMEEAGVLKVVDATLKSATLPIQEVTLMVGIALHCCEFQPVERPTMRDVVQMLKDVRRHRSFKERDHHIIKMSELELETFSGEQETLSSGCEHDEEQDSSNSKDPLIVL